MAAEYPPLGKTYVISYSNGDKDFPILAIKKDPRVDNYKRPDDLSPHPDSTRYPNHVFTGTQPTNTDERVIWIYEILPSPWIPFTRYDDDLGPIQGRRRSVANTGQEASLERDKKVSYEAREGSAIVSTELEETWDAGFTDPDKPSPFPIRDRDFYDASRGAIQERRQLVSTTGNEVATLENNNGIITQTSYEAYNEFLSFKIVQTYSVDGPQLVGNTTNNEGQLVTVTTQRKASDNYEPPQPSATRTVEISREDVESLVERIIDAPEVFPQTLLRVEKPVTIPERFLTSNFTTTEAETVADEDPTAEITGDIISQQVERTGVFTARKTTTERNLADLPQLNGIDYDQTTNTSIPFTEYISTTIPDGPCEADPIGDGKILVKEYDLDSYENNLSSILLSFPTRSSITGIPPKLKKFEVLWEFSESINNSVGGSEAYGEGNTGNIGGGGSSRARGTVSAIPKFVVELEEINGSNIPTTSYFFFLKYPVTLNDILTKVSANAWPVFKPKSYVVTAYGQTSSGSLDAEFRYQSNWASESSSRSNDSSAGFGEDKNNHIATINIPPCLCSGFSQNIQQLESKTITAQIPTLSVSGPDQVGNIPINIQARTYTVQAEYKVNYNLSATSPLDIPRTGAYLINSSVEPYKFGMAKVYAEVVNASVFS